MINCSLCGAATGVTTSLVVSRWINAVQALYIIELNHLEPKLSGEGESDTAPGSSSISVPESCHGVPQNSTPMDIDIQFATPILLPDGTLHPQTRITGFVFHANCFRLLEWECHPLPVNIRTLNLFLRSFGVVPDGQVVNWGHTFADLYYSFDSNNRTITPPYVPSQIYYTEIWEATPILLQEPNIVWNLLSHEGGDSGATKGAKKKRQSVAENHNKKETVHDTFSSLPPELLERILLFLPSHDFLQARLASRSLLAIPLTKTFWRSRFDPGHRFEHILEPRLFDSGVVTDHIFSSPEVVYKVLKNVPLSSSRTLANRSRIGSLLRPLASALDSFSLHEKQYNSVEPCGEPLASLWQPHLGDEDSARWDCAHGELLDSELQPFHFGCRPLFKRHITLSSPVTTVKVSVLPFHTTTYVTGLRFCFADGNEEAIGYVLSDREVNLPTDGILRGLRVATGERGVHALSVINKHGMVTAAAGTTTDLKVKKLGLGNPVLAVKAYFDGMKMVFIGIPDYIHNATGPYSVWKKARDFVEISSLPTI